MAAPSTIIVDDDGLAVSGDCDSLTPADYDTIQEAENNASPGDTIIVCPGVYDAVEINVSGITVFGLSKPVVMYRIA